MNRCDRAEPAAHMEEELRAENEQLRQEVAVLEEIAEGVAEANANALEMMLEVERAQAEVNATNAKLRAIIDNVEFGFLICDRTLRVSEEVTHSCLSLFGQSKVASRQLDEVLGLGQDQAAGLQMAIEEVFEDFLPEELTCEQIPSRFQIDGRVISMHARALRDESGEVQSLLFSIMDETDLEDERRQNAQNKALLKILNDRSAFLNFIGEMRSNVERARAALAAGEQTLLRRIVHTIKGNSAIFGLLDVVATAHRVEDGRTITSGGIAAIEDEVQRFLREHYPVLAVEWEMDSDPSYEVSGSSLTTLEQMLESGDLEGAMAWAREYRKVRADAMWGPVEELVDQLGERYGKQVRMQVSGGETRLDQAGIGAILGNIQHIVRNAVVHGIESAAERGDKAEQGLIQLRLAEEEHQGKQVYVVEVCDDGRGIDAGQLARRYLELGLGTEEEVSAMSEQEQLALIFRDRFTTRHQVDDNAGRGVGLSAVQDAVAAAGGNINIESRPGQGTRFCLVVPRTPAR